MWHNQKSLLQFLWRKVNWTCKAMGAVILIAFCAIFWWDFFKFSFHLLRRFVDIWIKVKRVCSIESFFLNFDDSIPRDVLLEHGMCVGGNFVYAQNCIFRINFYHLKSRFKKNLFNFRKLFKRIRIWLEVRDMSNTQLFLSTSSFIMTLCNTTCVVDVRVLC